MPTSDSTQFAGGQSGAGNTSGNAPGSTPVPNSRRYGSFNWGGLLDTLAGAAGAFVGAHRNASQTGGAGYPNVPPGGWDWNARNTSGDWFARNQTLVILAVVAAAFFIIKK